MNMIKCSIGHEYDSTLHGACPACARAKMGGYGPGAQPRQTNPASPPPPQAERPAAPTGIRQMGKTRTAYDMEVIGPGGHKRRVDPVVGWLVAIEGSAQGRAYPIRIGQNSIGRDGKNRICIEEDDRIGRDAHAHVYFDHVNTRFYFSKGTGTVIPFFRREVDGVMSKIPILQVEEMSPWDVIQLTSLTTIVFVPLCYDSENERYSNFSGYFKWDMPKQE